MLYQPKSPTERALVPSVTFAPQVAYEERHRDESDIVTAQLFDPFLSYLDPGIFNYDIPFSPDEVLASYHMNSFEEWLGGLQYSTNIVMPAQV